jgi:hypothetical protein
MLGRVSRRQEQELDEGTLVQRSNEFFDVLLEAFPLLAQVADGQLEPPELRKTSLLGSSTMLRVLAGVYHRLIEQGYDDDEITEFFGKLEPHMGAPVTASSPWVAQLRSGVFSPGASAPTSRRQDLKNLTDEVAGWMDTAPEWLKADSQ